MLDDFQRELSQLGYSFTVHRIHREDVDALRLPGHYNKEKTAGIICVEMFDRKYSNMLCSLGTPVLFVDSPVIGTGDTLQADCLYMENKANIRSFVREMVSRGKKRIPALPVLLRALYGIPRGINPIGTALSGRMLHHGQQNR